MEKRTFALTFLVVVTGVVTVASAEDVLENLDEMFRRKARHADVSIPAKNLEDPETFVWQPETLCYTDVETGREVWVLVRLPDREDIFNKECSTNVWSCDGSRMGIFSTKHRVSANPKVTPRGYHRWIVNTDGSGLKICEGYGKYDRPFDGFSWAHTELAYYAFGSHPTLDGPFHVLYKNVVGPGNVITGEQILDTSSADTYKKGMVKEGVSTDDKVIVARTGRSADTFGRHMKTAAIYRIALVPEPKLEVRWGVARGIPDNTYADHQESTATGFHGVVSPGPSPEFIYGGYSGGCKWKFLLKGSDPKDGGPVWRPWDGKSFGEISIESTGAGKGPQNPWGAPYFGHEAFDRWGHYFIHGDYTDDGKGTRIRDFRTRKWFDNGDDGYVGKGYYDGQHHTWTGWTDHVAWIHPQNMKVYGARYDLGTKSQYVICHTHYPVKGRWRNYNALPRPSQSPDGTKIAFAACWLQNGADQFPYISWAVAYYPRPPVNLKAVAAEGGVRLTWESPSYTRRGWPDETKDPPPPAREIKAYHVWRAKAAEGPWEEVGSAAVSYERDLERAIRVPKGLEFVDRPGDGTHYYAITSEEFSRLESRELSEILEVRIGGNTFTAAGVEKGGQKGFWKRPPAAPGNVSAQKSDTPGQVMLTWQEPPDGKVRYYNVYYATTGTPKADPRCRIASVPVGTKKYLDWLAEPNARHAYLVTSVDRQGNESPGVTVTCP